MVRNSFLVRVVCITYNQSAYIKDAMDGFCTQQTSFPFICTIIDDSSTDGEQTLIKQYLEDNFDIQDPSEEGKSETEDFNLVFARHKYNCNCYFTVLFLKYNHFKKGKRKMAYLKEMSQTKYIAYCEGDDYWITPNKLQKQTDYLESHNDYYMCFHAVDIKVEEGREYHDYFGKIEDREYKAEDIIKRWIVPACSMFYRSEINDIQPQNPHFVFTDDVMYATCLSLGKIYGMSEKMGVYRLVPSGWMASHSGNKRLYCSISQRKGLMEEFDFYRCDLNYQYMQDVYFKLMYSLIKEKKYNEFFQVKKDYRDTLPNYSMLRFSIYSFKRFLYPVYDSIRKLYKSGGQEL